MSFYEDPTAEFKFSFPTQVGDWNVFRNCTISNIDMADCSATIDGVCHTTNSLQECMDLCGTNSECNMGHYIETETRNICIPLKKQEYPYFRIRDKNLYPVMSNLGSTVFVKKSYPYPPDDTNVIFYTDTFNLKNKITEKFLGITDAGTISEDIIFTDYPINIQLLPPSITGNLASGYIPVKHGDFVVVNIPQSTFIVSEKNDNSNSLNWETKGSVRSSSLTGLQIFGEGKNDGDTLLYSDKIYFMYNNRIVLYDSNNSLVVGTTGILGTGNVFFELVPRFEVSYCEDGRCKSSIIGEPECIGKTVYRNPVCWNICPERKYKKDYGVYIFIFLLVLFLFLWII